MYVFVHFKKDIQACCRYHPLDLTFFLSRLNYLFRQCKSLFRTRIQVRLIFTCFPSSLFNEVILVFLLCFGTYILMQLENWPSREIETQTNYG